MELETRIKVSANWIKLQMSWLYSALVGPQLDAEKQKAFLDEGRSAALEAANALANHAFKLGVEYGRRNPDGGSVPSRGSLAGFLEAMSLLGAHMPDGMETTDFMSAEHDIICVHVGADALPEDSPAGLRLKALGWFVGEGWSRHV